MLTVEEVKRLLQDDGVPDDEALGIRDACYELAAVIVAQTKYKQARAERPDAHPVTNEEGGI